MNRRQTLDLFNRGLAKWNDWADSLSLEKRQLQNASEWVDGPSQTWNVPTRQWHEKAKVDFSGHVFDQPADFSRFRFPGDAVFASAEFKSSADFFETEFCETADFAEASLSHTATFLGVTFRRHANFSFASFDGPAAFTSVRFHRSVGFSHAIFNFDAEFDKTKFAADAGFIATTFSGRAVFHKSTCMGKATFYVAAFADDAIIDNMVFCERVSFDQATFKGPFVISHTSFEKVSSFATLSAKTLLLSDVDFKQLPDFSVAHFQEPPLFSQVSLSPRRLNKTTETLPRQDFPHIWRSLRLLAIQGHDHQLELQCLKGEITARRGELDKPFHLRFWAGWLYQIFSDFGRSMALPLFWLIVSIGVFAGVYAGQSPQYSHHSLAASVPCASATGDARIAALTLSIHNAFPFAGIGSSGKLDQVYACLYGTPSVDASAANPTPIPLSPPIPDSVAFLGALQFLVSAVILFLLVLAIRNWFRIK